MSDATVMQVLGRTDTSPLLAPIMAAGAWDCMRKPQGKRLPNLMLLRERHSLSQAELARAAGVGRATVARIENGAPARWATIRVLAAALNVEPSALMGD